MRLFGSCVGLLLTLTLIWSRPAKDRVMSLPGYGDLPTFEMYSGYLQGATSNIQLHYIFVEAQNSPSTAPLVLWLNGGPGCSSLMGMFSENGPFLIRSRNQLEANKHSWNKFANFIYLESPVGVGFSFSHDGNVTTDDDLVATHNYFALKNFFEKFPDLKERDFYITGESYGGVYVPTLALRVANHSEIKLKGVAVDNGLLSYTLNDNSLLYFSYYHSLIDSSLWADLVDYCCDGKLVGRCLFTLNPNPMCQDAIRKADKVLSFGLNLYNLYAPCRGGVPQDNSSEVTKNGLNHRTRVPWHNIIAPRGMQIDSPTSMELRQANRISRQRAAWGNLFRQLPEKDDEGLVKKMQIDSPTTMKLRQTRRISREHASWGNLFRQSREKDDAGLVNNKLIIECSDDSVPASYFNSPAVRSVLNIPACVKEWWTCDGDVYAQYKRVYSDLSQQYKTLLNNGVRILIFNGDVDMACNALGDEWFVNDLGLPLIIPRHPWFFNDTDGTRQIGGYTKIFSDKTSNTNLTFSTVLGAGHMVPTDKPLSVLTLFRNFIFNSSPN